MNVPGIDYTIIYDGRNITKDISGYIESITYNDVLEGASDEVQIVLDDSNSVWQNAWYPDKGSILELRIGTMNCGKFEIDEFISSGGAGVPSIFTIKALAAGKNSPIRSKKSYIHEKKTLKDVVTTFCTVNSMFLGEANEIENVTFERLTQDRQSDLSFISSLAQRFGHIFQVRNGKVTFTKQVEFETRQTINYKLTKGDYDFWNFKDKTDETFNSVKLEYYDPLTGEPITSEYFSTNFPSFFNPFKKDNQKGQVVDGFFNPDILRVYDTAENQTQADILARSSLFRKNSEFRTGTLSMKGNEKYVAGLIINVQGIGLFSGNYVITGSTHTINKNAGYRTELNLKHSNYSEVVETEEKD